MRDHKRPYIGQPMRRREDPRLLRGDGAYADDIHPSDALHVAFLRSPVSKGRILDCDVSEALEMPGVVAGFTGADLSGAGILQVNPILPRLCETPFPVLAQEAVAAVGQPVAAILADSPHRALDAVEAILLDLDEEMPDQGATAAAQTWVAGDCATRFAEATHVVEAEIAHPRLAPSPMEPRAITIKVSEDGATIWLSSQTPHRARSELARILSLPPEKLHVISQDVGGAFGMKASLYPEEVFAVWAAHHLGRNVKWTASRSEEFLSATHGRGLLTKGALALDAKGRFLALRAEVNAPLGPWLPNSALIPAWNAARILPGGYDIDTVEIQTTARMHHTAPTGIYRGAGRPEACLLMERLVDKAARVTGRDPVEIRRQNLLPASAMPHPTPTGHCLDSGDYRDALDRLSEVAAHTDLIAKRDAQRAAGLLSGVGIGFYVEPSGTGWESARVRSDGQSAEVETGGSSQGHGRETALAQIVADELGLAPSLVTVRHGETRFCPEGIGALASRSTPIGASAVVEACQRIKERRAAGEPGLIEAETRYTASAEAWGYGCYLAAMTIDRDTGTPEVTAIACVDDAGRLINPMLVEGQIMGGFAQGFGEAMMERLHYDEDGQLLTGSFMDYALPRAADLPKLLIHKMETPTSSNLLGAKGVGEAGTIGAPAALLNAAVDALAPLGIIDLQMPLTPLSLWQAIQSAPGKDQIK